MLKPFDEVFEDKTKYGTKIKTEDYHISGTHITIGVIKHATENSGKVRNRYISRDAARSREKNLTYQRNC